MMLYITLRIESKYNKARVESRNETRDWLETVRRGCQHSKTARLHETSYYVIDDMSHHHANTPRLVSSEPPPYTEI